MANAKRVKQRVAHPQEKQTKAGGSPRQLTRKAEVNAKRKKKAAQTSDSTVLTPCVIEPIALVDEPEDLTPPVNGPDTIQPPDLDFIEVPVPDRLDPIPEE